MKAVGWVVAVVLGVGLAMQFFGGGGHVALPSLPLGMSFWFGLVALGVFRNPRTYLVLFVRLHLARIKARNKSAMVWSPPPKFLDVVIAWITLGLIVLGVAVPDQEIDGGGTMLIAVAILGLLTLLVAKKGFRLIEGALQGAFGDGAAQAPVIPERMARDYIDGAQRTGYYVNLGTSTGVLYGRGDTKNGAPANLPLVFTLDDALMHFLFAGASQSGKSSAGIFPVMAQTLSSGGGVLDLEVKMPDVRAAAYVARAAGRKVHIVGPGYERLNGFGPLTSATVGDAVKDSIGESRDKFWTDAPSNFVTNWHTMIKGLDGETVDIPGTEDMPPWKATIRNSPVGLQQLIFRGDAVIEALVKHASDLIYAKYEDAAPATVAEDPHFEEQRAALSAQIQALRDRKEKTWELIEAGSIAGDPANKRLQELDAQIADLQAQIAELQPPKADGEKPARKHIEGTGRWCDSADPKIRERIPLLETAVEYFTTEYKATLSDGGSEGKKMLQSILAVLSAPLRQLTGDPEIRDAFSTESDFDFEQALDNGEMVLVYLDDTKYKDAVGFVQALLIRRLEAWAATRPHSARPVLVCVNELASVVSGDWKRMLERIRAGNVIIAGAIQSYSGVVSAIGDEHTAAAIIANFSNRFVSKTLDEATRMLVSAAIGSAEITRKSTNMQMSPIHMLRSGGPSVNRSTEDREIVPDWAFNGAGVQPNGTVKWVGIVQNRALGQKHDLWISPQYPPKEAWAAELPPPPVRGDAEPELYAGEQF